MLATRSNGETIPIEDGGPKRGLVPPAVSIPVAEDSGVITAVDGWVLEHACAEVAAGTRPARRRSR